MKNNNLAEGSVLKTLIYFALPFIVANILQSLYGAVDLFVVGKYCDAKSIAAVSTGTQITQIVTSLITGLTMGSTVLIGEYTGAKREEMIKKAIGTSLSAFFVAALVLTALMLVFNRPLLSVMKTPPEAFELTVQYVAVCSAGNIFICGYNAISAILRGWGDSVRPMVFVAAACVINIILDFIFVKYLNMGVAGTALATVISQAVSMIGAIIYLKKSNFIFDFGIKSFKPSGYIIRRLCKIGIPISFQEILVRISFLYLTAVMNNCGVYAASVVGIGSKFDVFAMLSATSIANALAAITAQNLGAGKPERAKRSLWYGLSFALVVSFMFWLWAQINPQSMIGVFSRDTNVIAAGVPYFKTCSYDYIMVTIVFCLNGYLNGRQKTLWTMISCGAGAVCLRIPMVYIFSKCFPYDLGMFGMIAPIVSGIMAIYTFAYVIIEGKKNKL